MTLSNDKKQPSAPSSEADVIEIGGTTWTVRDDDGPVALPPMRESEQCCPDCGRPLTEVQVDGKWISNTRCMRCRKRENDRQWMQSVSENNARRSQLCAKTLANFETPEDHQRSGLIAARKFVEMASKGASVAVLFWSSGYGTGKTHLASGIARAVQEIGLSCTSWVEPELFGMIRDSYNDHGASERRIIRKAVNANVLVIDDLGRAYVTDSNLGWYQEKIYRIINARYQRSGPLVITTNTAPADLPDRIGGAATSRLWEMTRGGDFIVDLNGPDWRFQ